MQEGEKPKKKEKRKRKIRWPQVVSGSFELRQKHAAVRSHRPLPCLAKKLEKSTKATKGKIKKRKKRKISWPGAIRQCSKHVAVGSHGPKWLLGLGDCRLPAFKKPQRLRSGS